MNRFKWLMTALTSHIRAPESQMNRFM